MHGISTGPQRVRPCRTVDGPVHPPCPIYRPEESDHTTREATWTTERYIETDATRMKRPWNDGTETRPESYWKEEPESTDGRACTGARTHFPREPDRPAKPGRDRNRSEKKEHRNKKQEDNANTRQEKKTQPTRKMKTAPTQKHSKKRTQQPNKKRTIKQKPRHKKKYDARLALGCAETAVNGGFPTKLGSVYGVLVPISACV